MFKSNKISVIAVYLSSLLQGLTLVSVPASSGYLRDLHGLSDSQYGLVFLPQVAMAILGSLAGAGLAARIGLKRVLFLAIVSNGLCQVCLASSSSFSSELAFYLILLSTTLLGLGFGLAAAPLNSLPQILFPNHAGTALVALHTLMGVGLSLGPLLARRFIDTNQWIYFPISLIGFAVLVMLLALLMKPEAVEANSSALLSTKTSEKPQRSIEFWYFTAIVVIYAFAEGTFSNWIVIYLQDGKKLPLQTATFALSVFWAAIAAGRLFISLLLLKISDRLIWRGLPLLMGAAFLLIPLAESSLAAILCFALAGFSCSAFFPLTVGLVSKTFTNHVAFVSSVMTAALMLGVGFGSFAIGPLRQFLTFETIYRGSLAYPLIILFLASLFLKAEQKRIQGQRAMTNKRGDSHGK